MKHIKLLCLTASVIAICCLVLSCKNSKAADTKEQVSVNQIEEQIGSSEMQGYAVPGELKYVEEKTYEYEGREYPQYIVDKFYPIGWSKDGKFAYIEEPADEAVGAYFFEFHILDLATGEEFFSWKPEEAPETGDITQMWNDHKDMFTQKLSQAGIIQQKEFKLDGLDVPYIGQNQKVWMETTMDEDENGFSSGNVVKELQVFQGTQQDNKVIFQKTHVQYDLVLDESLAGVIKSPYQNLGGAMVIYMARGYEGPPHVYHFYFLGVK